MRKKPAHRAMYLEDALHALEDMERTFAELETSDVFQAFTAKEKAQYRDVLSRLRYLIHDLEQDTAQEQLAS
jgi:acyl-CoA reductase-like NAD-dependent aldehyde dehydrogenase